MVLRARKYQQLQSRRFWIITYAVLAATALVVWGIALYGPLPNSAASAAVTAESNDMIASPPLASDQALAPTPPPSIANTITSLGQSFDGDVGIAVRSIDDGWVAGHEGGLLLPQQSLSKLWVAAAVLDQIDQGALSLDDPLTLTRADLSIFHQPIRKKILARGAYPTTIRELLRYAMTQSDNTANAALFRRVGGQAGVHHFLRSKGLTDIAMAESEKALQMGIVGMEWRDSYSYGRNFWQARKRLRFDARATKMGEYLAAPPDGTTALAVAEGLTRLAEDSLLSPQSSAYLIDLMAQSKTGPKRLRGGLDGAVGWSLPHKTGTGQVLKLLATAYNDVGILISPTGRRYAIVVMIGATNRPVPERQALMQAVTRSVVALEANAPNQ